MADTKISAEGAASALAGTEKIPGVQSGGNVYITPSQVKDYAVTVATIGAVTAAAPGKTTPVDADTLPLNDSAASNVLKKVTWANIKATLKTYFDTLYTAAVNIAFTPAGNISSTDVQAAIEELDTEKLPTSYLDTDGTLAANSDARIASQKAAKTYIDGQVTTLKGGVPSGGDTLNKLYNLINGIGTFVGGFDASGGTVPTSGSGLAGTIDKGDYWKITVAGTISGVTPNSVLKVGDTLFSTAAGASTGSQFFSVEGNDDQATSSTFGVVKLYTATGSNTDGGMDQNSSTTALAAKEATANKDATGGYAGLTLFKINFKNALNTFTSFFTNANTAARTYTFQDRNGTIADDTDLALKAPLASPTFTGTPAAPTAVTTTSTTQLATTAFVQQEISAAGYGNKAQFALVQSMRNFYGY